METLIVQLGDPLNVLHESRKLFELGPLVVNGADGTFDFDGFFDAFHKTSCDSSPKMTVALLDPSPLKSLHPAKTPLNPLQLFFFKKGGTFLYCLNPSFFKEGQGEIFTPTLQTDTEIARVDS
jgi:hypothetical protein